MRRAADLLDMRAKPSTLPGDGYAMFLADCGWKVQVEGFELDALVDFVSAAPGALRIAPGNAAWTQVLAKGGPALRACAAKLRDGDAAEAARIVHTAATECFDLMKPRPNPKPRR